MLHQIHHLFMLQKIKSVHQQVSCIAPKNKNFSNTMLLSDRVALVVILDSVGHTKGMEWILTQCGVLPPEICKQFFIHKNDQLQYNRLYWKRHSVKNLHHLTKKEKHREELKQKAADAARGMTYGSCMAVSETHKETSNIGSIMKKGKTTTPWSQQICCDCNATGHRMQRTRSCKNHHVYLDEQGKRIYVEPLRIDQIRFFTYSITSMYLQRHAR